MAQFGVVVIGRNEGERLVRCLNSVFAQATSVVYANSGSTDNSVAVAAALGVVVVKLDLDRPFTAARGRNGGFDALMAFNPDIRFVQFVDGDCELAADWVSAATSFLEKKGDVAVVCGRRWERNPNVSIYNYLCDIEWDTPIGEAPPVGGTLWLEHSALLESADFAGVEGRRGARTLFAAARSWMEGVATRREDD